MTEKKKSPESQKTEYKSSWQEEYFQWICGYANAKGGKLYIGVNDDGYVVGLKDTRYLLDILPNMIVDKMGIVVEIDYDSVSSRGNNIKYRTVPDDITQKPENLYVAGILTEKALNDIDKDPINTTNVTDDVQLLFDTAPGFVKQLRGNNKYREKIKNDLSKWMRENPIYIDEDGTLDYVYITVRAYPYGISYHGHYYTRFGGTTRELNGLSLMTFLMERTGKHWDGMPLQGLTVDALDSAAIDVYRKKAIENGRHTKEEVTVSDSQIISDLKLLEGEGEMMRAAILMFHSDPERFVTGASVKIAYFAPEGAYGANKSDDIIYHDEIHGPLIMQADKVVELIYTKYLKALVSYDGLQRIETFMTPKEAFREVILNAINHKVYESGNPIQISVYDDRIIIFNQGYWPEDIDLKDVYTKKHSSYPHNPNITRTFFNAGEIEAYGSGFRKIQIECDNYNSPYPEIKVTPNGVTVEIRACDLYMKLLKHGRYWHTYPEYKDKKEDSFISSIGDVIDDRFSDSHEVKTSMQVDSKVIASVDRMMEILTSKLSENEKELYLPIVEYLKTHDTIKNSVGVKLTDKSKQTVNRYLTNLVKLDVLIPIGDKKGREYRRK